MYYQPYLKKKKHGIRNVLHKIKDIFARGQKRSKTRLRLQHKTSRSKALYQGKWSTLSIARALVQRHR